MRATSAGLLLACAIGAACAQDVAPPHVVTSAVDWEAVQKEVAGSDTLRPILATADAGTSPLALLNGAIARQFPAVPQSAVPVLLPRDVVEVLREPKPPSDGAVEDRPSPSRLTFLMTGPTGYDAAISVRRPGAADDSDGRHDPGVLISGSSVLYDLGEPKLMSDEPVRDKDLAAQLPGIRRIFLEHHLRYVFVRFGVTYVVSTECYDGPSHGRRLSCTQADQILTEFTKALRIVGGAPQPVPLPVDTITRPTTVSETFTYAAPGQLLPNTGFRGESGRADRTVYAKIRFPLAQAPAYANSQSFMNWGDCDHTGRSSASAAKGAPYYCRVNGKPLVFDESVSENRAYPWRDNFCEHRSFLVGQCPGGHGHQGQDIRPATCKLRNEGGDRCLPYQDDVVAVRDGMILRAPGRELTYLFVNAQGEHIRFRYLHMNPKKLDADGVLSGRAVHEGEFLGKVGTFDRREFGTTYHLHFDAQVLTKYGWTFVNPYMTLVTAYERLIGARGQEIKEEPLPEASIAAAAIARIMTQAQTTRTTPLDIGRAQALGDRATVRAHDIDRRVGKDASRGIDERLKIATLPKSESISVRRRERDDDDVADRERTRAKRVVRALGHRVPAESHSARHLGSDVHAGHERDKARHGRLRADR
jgi:hypothetical protein